MASESLRSACAEAPLLHFLDSLAALHSLLEAARWDEVAEVAERLAEAVVQCEQAGVRLPPEAVEEAKTTYARCLTLTTEWRLNLNEQAHQAGSSNRAVATYNQG